MTTAAKTPEKIHYGDGSSVNFAAPFRFLAGALQVALIAADDTVSIQTDGVHYTVTGGDTDAGGTVTFLSAPASGFDVRIRRVTAREQGADYTPTDRFPAETHEAALDKAMMIDQEQDVKIADLLKRAIAAPDGSEGMTLDPSGLLEGDILQFTGGKLKRLDRSQFAGKFYGGDGSGKLIPLSGTGNDAALRADLADDGGALLVRYVPGGAYSANTVRAKLNEVPRSLEDFGDTTTDTATAASLTAYLAAAGGRILLGKAYTFPNSGGPYDLGAGPVEVLPAGAISGSAYLGSDRSYRNRLPVAYNNGSVYFDYVLGRKFKRPLEERERPLDGSSIDERYRVEAINMTAIETSRWPADTSDTWTAETPTTTASSVSYSVAADSNWHVSWVPVQGGQEVSATLGGAIADSIFGFFIRTTKGVEYFYAPVGLTGSFAVKLEGVASSVTSGVDWLGRATHESYAIHRSEVTLRAVNSRRYSILLNGAEIFPARDLIAPGEIVAVGFGVFGNNVATVSITNAVRVTKREQTGLVPLHIGIAGNSISDPGTHGCWDQWMREYLDGALGLKVLSITNLAVSGANSLGIASQISGGALGSSNVCLIVAPEVNDVQAGATVATTTGNINAMLDVLIAAGVKPILVTGFLWYSQALASGQGQATSYYQLGASHRAALRRLAATKAGCEYYDLSQTTGPMLATYLATPTVTDPELRDNIHPTARRYMLMGEALAKTVLRAYAKPMTPRVKDAAFPTGAYSWMANSWISTDAAWSLNDDGMLFLTGVLTAGTKTDGTTVFTLPRALRPTRNHYLTVSTDDAVTGRAVLQCQADGACKIYSMDAGASLIRLNCGFLTALAAR